MKKPNCVELLSAIRKKCLDCSGGMRSEVKGCKIEDCPLHPYRTNAIQDGETATAQYDGLSRGTQVSILDALREGA